MTEVQMALVLGLLIGATATGFVNHLLNRWLKRALRRMSPEQRAEWLNS